MDSINNNLPQKNIHQIREVLNAIAEISNHSNLDGIAKEACRQITKFVGASSCSISKWDKEENTTKYWAEYLAEENKYSTQWPEIYNLSEFPLSQQVLASGEPQNVRIDDPDADKAERGILKEFNAKTLLMLPLFSDDKIIGLVEILDDKISREFSEDEITLVKLFLNQVGIEIHQSSLLVEAQQRSAELSALRDISMGLTSTQSFDDVMNMILKSTLTLFEDAIDAHIFIYDNQLLSFGASLWSDGRKNVLVFEPRKNGLTYTVATEGKIIAVENFETDPLYKDMDPKWEGAIIGLPLTNQDNVVGVMNIAFKKPREFKENVLHVLTMLGEQAAITIERSRNVELIKKRAAELEALRQANLALTSSLNLNDVINTVLKSALKFSEDAMDAHIFIKEGEELVFGGALWADGSSETEWNKPRKNGLTYSVFTSGEIIAVSDVKSNELYTGNKAWKGNKGFVAIVGVPIIAKETVIGVMNLAYSTAQNFSDADLRSLALLSDQAALAIENARLHQIASDQAVTDALTGLPNRRAFEKQLIKEVLRAKRYKRSLVLLMIDLNNFKWINDNYGHPIGDKTLKMVGSVLRENIRETDFIARMGGDEFAMIMPETKKADAKNRTKKIAKKIKNHPFPWWKDNKENFFLTISVGFSCFPEDAENAEDMTLKADQDFYKSKKEAAK